MPRAAGRSSSLGERDRYSPDLVGAQPARSTRGPTGEGAFDITQCTLVATSSSVAAKRFTCARVDVSSGPYRVTRYSRVLVIILRWSAVRLRNGNPHVIARSALAEKS